MSDEYDDENQPAVPRKIYWQGSQWCVTDSGLETVKLNRYDIVAERLGDLTQGTHAEQFPSAERMRHVGKKTWVDIEDLAAAFAVALQVHEGRYEPLPKGAFHNALAGLRRSKIGSEVYNELREPTGAGQFKPTEFDGGDALFDSYRVMAERYPDRDVFLEVVDLPPRRGEP